MKIARMCLKQAGAVVLAAGLLVAVGPDRAKAGPEATTSLPAVTVQPNTTPPQAKQPATARLPATKGAQAKGKKPAVAALPFVEPVPIVPRGRAYLFRGALGPIFSRGMDRLTEKLQRAGITADVNEFTICPLIASSAAKEYKRDPQPIILIGHSMGGRCAVQFSERLQEDGIPVSLVVSIDPAHLSPDVPANVERFINIFLSKDILGGGDIVAIAKFPGHYASYDVQLHDEISHINIDKNEGIHQQLIDKIVQLVATPAKVPGEIVPLRYAVPPNEPIELWDSGMPVAARAGDTLQTLAAQYGVPLWSLTQINQVAEDAPLTAGQRIIVPRRLVPVVATAQAPAAAAVAPRAVTR